MTEEVCYNLVKCIFLAECFVHTAIFSIKGIFTYNVHSYFFVRTLKNLAEPKVIFISSHTFS